MQKIAGIESQSISAILVIVIVSNRNDLMDITEMQQLQRAQRSYGNKNTSIATIGMPDFHQIVTRSWNRAIQAGSGLL